MTSLNNSYEICKMDLLNNSSVCYLECPKGSFSLPGMMSCHPWLDCDANLVILSLISMSVVKVVYLADWKGYSVVLSVLSSEIYEEDFLHNLFMIRLYSPNENVVNLLGFCENSIVTEYYELGNALNTQYHLNNLLRSHDNFKTRINLCISYASIIEFLHNAVDGVRVMCDSNTLEKALSQYLMTVDLKLVVNDLDALPKVDILKGGVHCGNKELSGSFIAPEQKWPYPGVEYDKNKMPFYNEKVDIFKIPDICNWFLGDSPEIDVVKYKLYNVHKSCKSVEPHKRPSASFIFKEYKNILNDLN